MTRNDVNGPLYSSVYSLSPVPFPRNTYEVMGEPLLKNKRGRMVEMRKETRKGEDEKGKEMRKKGNQTRTEGVRYNLQLP